METTRMRAMTALLGALLGCSSSLEDRLTSKDDGGNASADAQVEQAADAGARAGATFDPVAVVTDASDQTTPRYFDLDTGREVGEGDGWDLSFRRFQIRMNGGVSGERDVAALRVEDGTFEDLERAPQGDYTTDEEDGADDDDAEADNVFNNGTSDWYDYDVASHTLTSKRLPYAVRSSEGRYFKLVLDDYYDAAGSPAIIAWRFARVVGPNGEGEGEPAVDAGAGPVEADAGTGEPADAGGNGGEALAPGEYAIDARDSAAWVYVRVGEGVVAVNGPETSEGWDLAFRRTELRTNSGTSGLGHGGAKLLEGVGYGDVVDTGTMGFSVDTELSSGAPGASVVSQNEVLGGWYDYDPASHVVSPGARVYALRTASGGHAKLQIDAYASGQYRIRLEPIARVREVRELDVDASVSGTFVYLDLAQGALVSVAADQVATSLAWDLGFSRTNIRTNGGVSGSGLGGALEAAASDLTALALPAGEPVRDTSVSSGAPGSVAVNTNAVLGTWYAYDAATHVVSPRDTAFVVYTAAGELAGLKVLSYGSGIYRVAITYAGAGQDAF
jgi:HmuY protein